MAGTAAASDSALGRSTLLLAAVHVTLVRGHSWAACTDYRGDVNFFEQDRCVGWPRQYTPSPIDRGYQIASPEARAHGGDGCDIAMASPDWRSNYSPEFQHAIYEPGQVYCLAWPMKNHGWLSDKPCSNSHSKSDAGVNDSLTLYVSSLNPSQDPSQAQFNSRNINELAGFANNCDPGSSTSQELTDSCQLGLEKHMDYERDCKGFLRSPKFCDSSGMAMGTGCFKVPEEMRPGHYVGQWFWRSSFRRGTPTAPYLQTISYTTCFDFEVVPRGSPRAHAGEPGTTGVPESDLPCTNNVEKFTVPGGTSSTQPSVATTSTTTSLPESTPTASTPAPSTTTRATPSSCVEPFVACAGPGWGPECCSAGHSCIFWQDTEYAQCLPSGASTTTTTTTTTACLEPYVACAAPGWGPACCSSGHSCVFWQDTEYAQCLPSGASTTTTTTTSLDVVTASSTSSQQLPSSCVAAYGSCAGPDMESQLCCVDGYTCSYWQGTQYGQCLPAHEQEHLALTHVSKTHDLDLQHEGMDVTANHQAAPSRIQQNGGVAGSVHGGKRRHVQRFLAAEQALMHLSWSVSSTADDGEL